MSETAHSDPVFITEVSKCPTCGADALDRSEFWEANPPNGADLEQRLSAIKKAIENYYLALDRREHADIAKNKAFRRIEETLGMKWNQGETTKWLESVPRLKKFYD